MKSLFVCFCVQLIVCTAIAQNFVEMPLWTSGAPESNGITEAEVTVNNHSVQNISEAKIYVYHPERQKNTGTAVVICPGGGYIGEAIFHEGHDYAKWLIEKGVTAVVLKYRLPNRQHFIPLKDAQRALRTVRHHASEWGVDPSRIGISGFSAGGHLASTAGTHFDSGNASSADPVERLGCRPDFMVLFYPVITMKEEFTHIGSRNNLMGQGYNAELVRLYSNEEQVTAQTPPAFLILSDDDKVVVPRNSTEFYSALKRQGIPAALHIIASGGHGWGTNSSSRYFKEWSIPLENWMVDRKLITKN
jgi:acetyl esterase/lipase